MELRRTSIQGLFSGYYFDSASQPSRNKPIEETKEDN